jgi:very-short-patch-repair endonuclease
LDIGLRSGAIRHRLATRELIAVHRGVYAVGHVQRMPIARAAAAVLACGPDATLSHFSAASLWGIIKGWSFPLEVSCPSRRSPAGIRTHRAVLDRRDIRYHYGIRVTSPARALLDIAPRSDDEPLARAVADARLGPYMRDSQLEELLDRLPNHKGAPALRAAAHLDQAPTRSRLEQAFLAFTRKHGLPMPKINAKLAGYEVDALYERERVIIEVDSWTYHGDRSAFEHDRERDAVLLALGYVTIRITSRRLENGDAREAARLRTILETRRATAA